MRKSAPSSVHVRKRVHFEWTAEARPFEHAEAAGKQLRLELDRAGIGATKALVSLPREEAVVRLLELPECSDDELPELVRLQAATRSAVPLDRLLLDFLPLPRLENVAGRRVLMVTLGKVPADRIQAILTSAGLEAAGILLSAVGTSEIVAHQPRVSGASDEAATLIVSRSGSRLEITAIWRKQILFMHAANVSAHLPPEAGISQILAETSRATVALSQAAPGIRIGSGWLLSSAAELAGLPEAFRQRFGFEFQTLDTAFRTPGVQADFDPAGTTGQTAFSALGLLFGQADGLVSSIDFLHPRKTVVKPDRRRLRQVLAGGAVLATVVAIFAGIHMRVVRLDDEIAKMEADNASRDSTLKKNAALGDRQDARRLDRSQHRLARSIPKNREGDRRDRQAPLFQLRRPGDLPRYHGHDHCDRASQDAARRGIDERTSVEGRLRPPCQGTSDRSEQSRISREIRPERRNQAAEKGHCPHSGR